MTGMVLGLSLLAQTSLVTTPQPVEMRWVIIDAADGKTTSVQDDPKKLTVGGRLTADLKDVGLSLDVEYLAREGGTEMRVALRDATGRDRGLVLRLELTLPAGESWEGWIDQDVHKPLGVTPVSNTAALRGLPGLPEFANVDEKPQYGRYSIYPLGVVSRGKEWMGLARRPSEMIVSRFTALGGATPLMTAEVDLALSEYTAPPREAGFSLWFLWGTGEGAGMRAGLERCYALWPGDWEVRAKVFGGWMPFRDLAALPNVDEFGFAYQEGAPNAAFDDALGVLSFVYFHCAGEFANVSGYKRGTEPLPPYETIVDAFNKVAAQHTGIEGVWDVCGIRNSEGKIDYRPEKTYGDFFCQACMDPDLPYGKAMAEGLVKRVLEMPFPKGIDGVYYDGVAAGLDYAPEHLKAANHLLLWDAVKGFPVNYNLFSSVEWAQSIHEALSGTGKLTMLNDGSLSAFAYVMPYIDVLGGELGINMGRGQSRAIRAYAYTKPFCTLVKADFRQYTSAHIETYMRRCAAYGILFGFFDISPSGDNPGSSYWEHPEWFDRDRRLFRRYMPLAREIARAGWQPVPEAMVDGGTVYIERFGPRESGLTYLTLSTDPGEEGGTTGAARDVTVRLSQPLQDKVQGGLAVELITGHIEPAGVALRTSLGAEDLQVWALGDRGTQAATCVERARDLLERRDRYIEASRLAGTSLSPWRPYGEGGAKIVSPGREGGLCLEANLDKPGGAAGASQSFDLNQEHPAPLIASAWSKAENVTGVQDSGYALYVDCYYTDGTALYGQTVEFATGTHEWQYGERLLKPEKPIARVNVYLLFRGNHTGRVWYDDVRVALADKPEENLLRRPGFEVAEGRPLVEEREPGGINEQFTRLRALLTSPAGPWNFAVAEQILAAIETAVRRANWGADGERTLRDVEDLRWHLRLAEACDTGRSQAAQRPSRLTEQATLGAERKAAPGVGEYTARSGKVPPGTVVLVDSLYDGYSALPLTDGLINPAEANWAKVAWASDENEKAHWIELRLPQPRVVKEVRLWWAKDAGTQPGTFTLWVSREVTLQVWRKGEWVPVDGQDVHTDAERGVTVIRVTSLKAQRVRVYQPPLGGPADRKGLMWVSEVEIE